MFTGLSRAKRPQFPESRARRRVLANNVKTALVQPALTSVLTGVLTYQLGEFGAAQAAADQKSQDHAVAFTSQSFACPAPARIGWPILSSTNSLAYVSVPILESGQFRAYDEPRTRDPGDAGRWLLDNSGPGVNFGCGRIW
jgi:hypothetical protein